MTDFYTDIVNIAKKIEDLAILWGQIDPKKSRKDKQEFNRVNAALIEARYELIRTLHATAAQQAACSVFPFSVPPRGLNINGASWPFPTR